jgi:hypothetical protein
MQRILSIYTFAAAVALCLMLTSPFMAAVNPAAPVLGILLLLSGVLTAAFVWGYMTYAVAEYGEFTPQGAALAVFFVLAYAVMYVSLTAMSVLNAGALNLSVWAAVLASAAVMLYMLRHVPLHITSGNPLTDVAAGVKTLPLALAVGFPLGWIILALYEAGRMFMRRAYAAAASVVVSILLLPLALMFVAAATGSFIISVFGAQATGVEVLAWPGIIAWEELTTRFLLPAAGPLANYMFVALHAPSRWIMALFLAPAILAIISMGTRWITDIYKRHGLIGAISAHSVYNGMIGWLAGLIYFPILTIATFIVLVIAYIYVKSSGS